MLQNSERIMIVAPHADDEAFGCGGLLVKYGPLVMLDVHLVLCSAGDIQHRDGAVVEKADRTIEFKKVAKAVGATMEFLDLKDTLLQEEKPLLLERIEASIDAFEPDTLLFPYKSFHQDHMAVYEMCFAALRPGRSKSVKKVLCYEVPNYVWSKEEDLFKPNYYMELDQNLIRRKIDLCKLHASQVDRDGSPIDLQLVFDHAVYRGHEVGLPFAEAYRIISIKD